MPGHTKQASRFRTKVHLVHEAVAGISQYLCRPSTACQVRAVIIKYIH